MDGSDERSTKRSAMLDDIYRIMALRVKKENTERNAIEDARDSEEVITTSRWEDLPINCLLDVFMRLGLDDMTLAVPFVCKSWYKASLEPCCWKILDLYAINPCPGSPFGERFKHDYRLEEFTMRGFLKFIINRSNKLATRILLPSVLIPLQDLFYVLDECPKVKMYRCLESRQGYCVCISPLVLKLKEMTFRTSL